MLGSALRERLEEVRCAGDPALAPLWIEVWPADAALGELETREGAIFRLQEARILMGIGRPEEAQAVLEGIDSVPPGLAPVQEGLLAELAGLCTDSRPGGRSDGAVSEDADDGLASVTLAELYATQGEVGAALAVYKKLLAAAPGNESLRRKVRALQGEKASETEAALIEWLDRVRGWRRVLGV
jgi:hypothetical protein